MQEEERAARRQESVADKGRGGERCRGGRMPIRRNASRALSPILPPNVLSEMLLGPTPPGYVFTAKHRSNAYAPGPSEAQG